MVNALMREAPKGVRQSKEPRQDHIFDCLCPLRTSLLQPWAVPSCDVINWTSQRSRASSCASYMFSKACLRVTSHSRLIFLSEYLHTELTYMSTVPKKKKSIVSPMSLPDALFTYWNKASSTELMDFLTLIE